MLFVEIIKQQGIYEHTLALESSYTYIKLIKMKKIILALILFVGLALQGCVAVVHFGHHGHEEHHEEHHDHDDHDHQ